MYDHPCCGDLATIVANEAAFEVIPHLVRIIAKGRPVSIQEIADLSSQPAGTIEDLLRNQPGTDWDDDGRVVGFGVTLRPTAHRFEVAGRTLYTFCAPDSLLFTHMLGEGTVVDSTCPGTSSPIHIELTPDAVSSIDPISAVVTQPLLDPGLVGDVRRNFCDHGHFFASSAAASGWSQEHPDGQVLTVAEAFEQARRDIAEVGWLPGPPVTK